MEANTPHQETASFLEVNRLRQEAVSLLISRLTGLLNKLNSPIRFFKDLSKHAKQTADLFRLTLGLLTENAMAYEFFIQRTAEAIQIKSGKDLLQYNDIIAEAPSLFEARGVDYIELEEMAGVLWMGLFTNFLSECQRFTEYTEKLESVYSVETDIINVYLAAGPRTQYQSASHEDGVMFTIELMDSFSEIAQEHAAKLKALAIIDGGDPFRGL